MVCQSCKHEFCWLCLAPYYSYSHGEERYCPARNFCIVVMMLFLAVMMNLKSVYQWEWLCVWQKYIFYSITALILIDIIAFTVGIYAPLIGGFIQARRDRMYYGA